MSNACSNGCSKTDAPTLLFSCSGGSDVGELADRSMHFLAKDGACFTDKDLGLWKG